MPGESDVVVRRQAGRPVRGVVSLDDSGQTATGKYQASATLAIDGPLALNDLVFLSHNQALDRDGGARNSRGTNGYYSIPYGYWTFAFAGSDFDYRQTIQGVNAGVRLLGRDADAGCRIARVVHRTQASRTAHPVPRAASGVSSGFIDDVEILAQRRRLSAAELSVQHRHQFGRVYVDGSLAFRQGVPWFDAEDRPPDAGPDVPDPRYRLWTLDLLVALPFEIVGTRIRYQGVFRGQATSDALFSQDFFSIGNRFTVRGFDGRAHARGRPRLADPQRTGDAGADPRARGLRGARPRRGRADRSRDCSRESRLTGAVAGFRGGWRGLLYEAFVGWGLRRPDGFGSDTPNYGFQLLYSF